MTSRQDSAKDAAKNAAKNAVAASLSTLSNISRKIKPEGQPARVRNPNDPLRVALMCPYSMSVPGGVQKQVLLLSAEMRKRGIDARIIAPCDGVPPTPYVISVGTTRSLKSNGSLAPIADDNQSSSLTLDALASFGPDVVHIHEPLVPGPTTAAMIGADCAIVATFHAAGEGARSLKYFRHPARSAISRVNIRCCVSSEAQLLAEQYLPGDYEIVPNCVDVKKIASYEPWPSPKPAVLFVGRHEERKGLRFLLEAWMESDIAKKSAHLWVAGSGDETSELVSLTKNETSISFLGRIDYSELFRRMRASRIVVAPALYGESFGIILLEAMAAHSCVVASAIPGYREVARDGKEAVLVPPGDASALRVSIENLLSDEDLRKTLESAGFERCQEFSVEKVVTMYVDIYKRAIQESV